MASGGIAFVLEGFSGWQNTLEQFCSEIPLNGRQLSLASTFFFLASIDVAVLNEPGATPKLGFLPLKTSMLHYIRGKKSSCWRSFGTNCKQTKTRRKQRSSPVVSETEQDDHKPDITWQHLWNPPGLLLTHLSHTRLIFNCRRGFPELMGKKKEKSKNDYCLMNNPIGMLCLVVLQPILRPKLVWHI